MPKIILLVVKNVFFYISSKELYYSLTNLKLKIEQSTEFSYHGNSSYYLWVLILDIPSCHSFVEVVAVHHLLCLLRSNFVFFRLLYLVEKKVK